MVVNSKKQRKKNRLSILQQKLKEITFYFKLKFIPKKRAYTTSMLQQPIRLCQQRKVMINNTLLLLQSVCLQISTESFWKDSD